MKDYASLTKSELVEIFHNLEDKQKKSVSADDLERTLNELQLHQLELEMQNRELKESREGLEHSLNRYAVLYDHAPVGYCTLDEKGIIKEINLTGAKMLALERDRLLGMPFIVFVSEGDMGKFFRHI